MTAKQVLNWVTAAVVYAALIFGGAGTIFWPEGSLFFLSLLALGGATISLKNPGLIRERTSMPIQKGQESWDKWFQAIFSPLILIWFVLNGADAVRYGWSSVPWLLKWAGGIELSLGGYLVYRVFQVNTFAAPVVKLQEERGQHVVSTGPYAHVRHPLYSGVALFFTGASLLMGAWYGLALSAVIIVLFVGRTILEDRMLRRELPGYADYSKRVRYRLVPHIW